MSFVSSFEKPTFIADQKPTAQKEYDLFLKRYKSYPLEKADVVIVFGGDGFMLRVLHNLLDKNMSIPVYGLNCGTVGFLMNTIPKNQTFDLFERLSKTHPVHLHPLIMQAITDKGQQTAYAINEISLSRQTAQSAKISLFVNNILRLETLIGDGVLLSTPAGSTAYNFSAGGPILPLEANLLALTPINVFRPRRWHGALLPRSAHVRFDVLELAKRPVKCAADFHEVLSVQSLSVQEDPSRVLNLLFDPEQTLERRIVEEQFMG